MEEDERRNVFNATLVLDRPSTITATAVDHDGTRIFLGLHDGMLEEYALDVGDHGVSASLTARKPLIAKHPILAIYPAISANCVVVLTAGEASLRFVHSDTLESKQVIQGPVLAAAVTLPSHTTPSLPLLAVATRTGIGRALLRITVHEIVPAGGRVPSPRALWDVDLPFTTSTASSSSSSSPTAVCLTWAGPNLVVGIGNRYLLAWNTRSSHASRKGGGGGGGTKGAWRELLSVDESDINVVADGNAPTQPMTNGSSSRSNTTLPVLAALSLPQQACALMVVGAVGVVVNPLGEPVGNPISLLLSTSPSTSLSPLRALASAQGMAILVYEQGIQIADPSSGTIIQTLPYGAGLQATPGQPLRASGGGAPTSPLAIVSGRHKVWALTPLPAQEQARDLLRRCSYTKALELASTAIGQGREWGEVAYAQAGLMLLHEGEIQRAMACFECCAPAVFPPHLLFPLFPLHMEPWESLYQDEDQTQTSLYWGLSPPLTSLEELLAAGPAISTSDSESLLQDAKQHIVQYLFRARQLPGDLPPHIDGIDTLLLHLLIDLDASDQAAAFTAVPNRIRPLAVASRLADVGWDHALATLWAASGRGEAALRIWKEVVGKEVEVGERVTREGVEGAVGVMMDGGTAAAVVVAYLPWLLTVSPLHAGQVLESRTDLVPSVVLPLLPRGSDARWQYLHHVIIDGGNSTTSIDVDEYSELHTELAVSLIEALFAAEPALRLELSTARSSTTSTVRRRRTTPLTMVVTSNVSTDTSAASITTLISSDLLGTGTGVGTDSDTNNRRRLLLRKLLETSSFVDIASTVVPLLEHTSLLEELVIAHWRLGLHPTALRLLAIDLHDLGAAVAYTTAYLPPPDHRILVDILMRPGGRGGGGLQPEAPRWEEVGRVLTVLGGSVDALEVIQQAPEEMPMPVAVSLIAPLLRERLHRRRQGLMRKALHKSRAALRAAAQVDVEGKSVVIDESRACPVCRLRLGGKVFVLVPHSLSTRTSTGSGTAEHGDANNVMCLSCWNKKDPASDSDVLM